MAYIGIDLGTTYSAAARCMDGVSEVIALEGLSTMPSVVGLQANGKIAIGNTAKRNQARFPENTILEVKRKMGEKTEVVLGSMTFSPQEVSAQILLKIKELAEAELGEEVQGAVISCPAYFKDPQKSAINEAAQIAGLKVLRIINEPTAAAYAYGVMEGNDDSTKLFLVYDLGGGTFDVTVIQMMAGKIEVIGTGGDPQLGGGNFDDEIVNWMLEKLEDVPGFLSKVNDSDRDALKIKLKSHAEKAKIDLCNSKDESPEVRIQIPNLGKVEGKPVNFNEVLSRAEFEERIETLLVNSFKEVDRALEVPKSERHEYDEDDITAVLLVGGSTRVPAVRRKLEERFPSTEIRGEESGINPDEIVAIGAGIMAASVASETDFSAEEDAGEEMMLVDVTGHTLSVEVMEQQSGQLRLVPIIPKETKIPCKAKHRFSAPPGATAPIVKVYQGESQDPNGSDSLKIGEFTVNIDRISEDTPLMIGLDLDENGLLVAHAFNEFSQENTSCQIDYDDSSKMSEQELEEKRKKMAETLDSVIGTEAPLGGGGPDLGGGAAMSAAPPMGGAPPENMPPVSDPTQAMNPILRSLYQKAVTDYSKIPADRQSKVMELVSKIDAAARENDQNALNSMAPELSALLEGV